MILEKLLSRQSIESPTVPLSAANIMEWLGGRSRSSSGKLVNATVALQYSPVWAAVDLLSGDVAKLPFRVYRRLARAGAKEPSPEHPVWQILRKHTGEMTANLWLQAMVAHALLHGAAYSQVLRIGRQPVGLRFIHSDRVRRHKERGMLFYTIRNEDNQEERVERDAMFVLNGLVIDELGGLSLVQYARDTIGRYLSAESYGDEFFANSAVPDGWLQHPGQLSAQAQERLLAGMAKRHTGEGNRHRTGILEEGMTWTPTGITPHDALLVDQLKLGVSDVARFTGVPPHKLGDEKRTSYKSLEEENRSYHESSLGRWLSRLEFEANELLFTEQDKSIYFAEFLADAILRADTKTRYEVYAIGIQWGILSPNEARSKENLNPRDGGDDYLTPLNMQSGQPPAPADEDEEPEDESNAARFKPSDLVGFREVLNDRLSAMAKRLVNSARTAAKNPRKFLAWVNEMDDHHGAVLTEAMRPVVALCCKAHGLDTDETNRAVVNSLFIRSAELFLTAAECDESRLIDNVGDVLIDLMAYCGDLATSLATEGKCNANRMQTHCSAS